MALTARFAVVVGKFVAAGHALQEVLVTDAALPGQGFRQFQRVLSRLPAVFGFSFFGRLAFLAHGSFSQLHRFAFFAFGRCCWRFATNSESSPS